METGSQTRSTADNALRVGLLVGLIVALGLVAGWSALRIVGALVFSIFLHELGHYVAARMGGMKATQFFIGFGPTIWSFQRGETEYGVKLIPAGAFVKIVGMSNLEPVDPQDEARTYRQQSFLRRMAVALGGSFMHLVQALVLIVVFLATIGTPSGQGLFDAYEDDDSDWSVEEVVDGSAAQVGGLVPGDKITEVDGTPIVVWSDLTDIVSARPNTEVVIEVVRDGAPFDATVVIGSAEDDPTRGQLGVMRSLPEVALETRSLIGAISEAPGTAADGVGQSLGFLGRFLSPSGMSNFISLVAAADDEPAPVGQEPTAPPKEAPDESLRPVSVIGVVDIGTQLNWAGIILLMIQFNLFIGVFNLLPMLPFDGGHVAIAVYERVREALRPGERRYFADIAKLLPLTYAVILALVAFGLSTMYLDVVSRVGL